ncbi:hypothetical protein P154DRAFT_561567 [Amniculicola lignicola CBS 123094]|uniref:C2H2-type domain-containing protein n=1 Tax=Amniculicola lignicola CBS 123094 TaxID=1392246 RepID=A0A6A5WVI8_9PLEO|nr:hypothetical protein P154DRAFT_561567 [Amniculicola lignicola CBS 123094]
MYQIISCKFKVSFTLAPTLLVLTINPQIMPGSQAGGLYEGEEIRSTGEQSPRPPCFLQRNLKRAIEAHDKQLRDPQCSTSSATPKQVLGENFWSKSRRGLPRRNSRDALNRHLIVKIRTLRPIPIGSRTRAPPHEPLEEEEHAAPYYWTSARIGVTILNDTGQAQKSLPDALFAARASDARALLKTTIHAIPSSPLAFQQGRIIQGHDSDKNHILVTLTPEECDTNLSTTFTLLITLNLSNNKQGQSILSFLETQGQCSSPRWVARWNNILSCPEGYQLLPLECEGVGSERKSLGLALEVLMEWAVPHDVAVHKSIKNDIRHTMSAQSNASSAMSGGGLPQILETKYRCGECNRSFGHIDELHMHLKLLHGDYNWHRSQILSPSEQRWQFKRSKSTSLGANAWEFELSTNLVSSGITILAPLRPFDKRKYLDEDNVDWQLEALCIFPRRQTNSVPDIGQEVTQRARTIQQAAPSKRRYKIPKAPDGVTLFRSLTKRPLQDDEEVTESDNDTDLDWIQSKKAAAIDGDPKIPERAKRFLKCFDLFIREERILYEVYIGDVITRFVLAKGTWLWKEDLVGEFVKKALELVEDEIITKAVLLECRQILLEEKREIVEVAPHTVQESESISIAASNSRIPLGPATNAAMNAGIRVTDKGKGKAKVVDTDYPTPQTDEDGDVEMQNADDDITTPDGEAFPETTIPGNREMFALPLNQCICGEDPRIFHNKKPRIYCESDECRRHVFHVDCVMQQWRPIRYPDPLKGDWYCLDCERDTDVEQEGVGWEKPPIHLVVGGFGGGWLAGCAYDFRYQEQTYIPSVNSFRVAIVSVGIYKLCAERSRIIDGNYLQPAQTIRVMWLGFSKVNRDTPSPR